MASSSKGEERGLARRTRGGLGWPERFEEMEEAMDRMFEPGAWGGPWWRFPRFQFPAPRMAFRWAPAIDVFEREGNLVVRADVPGVKAEDIEVSVEDDVLTIRGSRKEETEVKEQDYYRSERSFGEFRRSVRVPKGTKPEQIKATFKDGVLEVVAPKPAEAAAKPNRVKIETK
jgi:HSP20 family protein